MYKLLYASLAILAGVICYIIARKRGITNPDLWFVAGILFNVFAIGAVMYVAKYFTRVKKGAPFDEEGH